MKYFFITGRLPRLSFAELDTLVRCSFKSTDQISLSKYGEKSIILSVIAKSDDGDDLSPDELDERMERLFQKLGGFLRFGRIIEDQDEYLQKASETLVSDGKITFGISSYGDRKFDEKKLARQVKQSFVDRGVSVRYIIPHGKRHDLNTARIGKNDIIKKGFELVVMDDGTGQKLAGYTMAIQDYRGFAIREYDRPAVSKYAGMLPLKLARIMLNLTGVREGGVIWDPFCGSGTILTEGLMLGYDVIGSDKETSAVNRSTKNIDWLKERYIFEEGRYNVFKMDIDISPKYIIRLLRETDIHALVYEPYMGPPLRHVLPVRKAKKIIDEVADTYRNLFRLCDRIRHDNLVMVAVVPSYKTTKGWVSISMGAVVTHKWRLDTREIYKDISWQRPSSVIKRNIMIWRRGEGMIQSHT